MMVNVCNAGNCSVGGWRKVWKIIETNIRTYCMETQRQTGRGMSVAGEAYWIENIVFLWFYSNDQWKMYLYSIDVEYLQCTNI